MTTNPWLTFLTTMSSERLDDNVITNVMCIGNLNLLDDFVVTYDERVVNRGRKDVSLIFDEDSITRGMECLSGRCQPAFPGAVKLARESRLIAVGWNVFATRVSPLGVHHKKYLSVAELAEPFTPLLSRRYRLSDLQ